MKDINRYNLKLRTKANFIMLPVNSIFDNRLTKIDFNILAYLSLMQGNNDGCWTTIGYICSLLGIDIKSKKRYIKKRISNLENLGYVKRIQRYSRYHKSSINFYHIVFKEQTTYPEIDMDEINRYSLEKEEFDEEFKNIERKSLKQFEVKNSKCNNIQYHKNKFLNALIAETIKINLRFGHFYEHLNLQRPINGKLYVKTKNEFTKDYFSRNFLRDMLKACQNLNYSINLIEVVVENY